MNTDKTIQEILKEFDEFVTHDMPLHGAIFIRKTSARDFLTESLNRIAREAEEATKEKIRNDFNNLEKAAGDTCFASEGTQGCEDASLYQAINGELDRYFEQKVKEE